MPAIIKPLLGLALLFGRLQAETPYEALCSSPPSQPDELEPGVTATYQCGHAFYTDDWTGKSSFAETPKACALQCARWSSEGRCGWQSDVCYQYNAGKDSAARAGGVAIYIGKTSRPVPVPDCSAMREECNHSIAAKEHTITSMQADLTTQQKAIETLEHEKTNCEQLLYRTQTDLMELQNKNQRLQPQYDDSKCGISHESSFVRGNTVWKAFCSGYSGGPIILDRKVNTPKECVEACIDDPNCTHANWTQRSWYPDGKLHCYTKKNGNKRSPEATSADWASVIRNGKVT